MEQNNVETVDTHDMVVNAMESNGLVATDIVDMEPAVGTEEDIFIPCLISFGAGVVTKILIDLGVRLYRRHKEKKAAEEAKDSVVEETEE